MQTLIDVLRKTAVFFAAKGLEKPRLQAELLVAGALRCRRLDLYLQFERPLDEATLDLLRGWVRRRAAREPVQYIVGEVAFRELVLKCDARALIPRPETEELVGFVLEALPRTVEGGGGRVVDLGTGTGAIALSLARERADVCVVATDVSADTLALARENARRCGLGDERVSFAHGDWLEAVRGDAFDAVVSNPPYLTEEEWDTAEPEVARHEPRLALVAGDGGLAHLKTILGRARGRLRAGGFVALEMGVAHSGALAAHAVASGYARHECRVDLSGRERFFFAWI
ncbi:MAG: peptide chain release factor N(5)-glutamine methyltransferase [Puniceicoccales bacterium]|nr:peptide chain release factor N(5)-glutamine methyltransferase [Puniceicoccales bacterium]